MLKARCATGVVRYSRPCCCEPEHFDGMEVRRSARQKLMEWVRRYLPCEIAGTVGELGGAALAYLSTGSYAAAAIVATIGASAGYYAAAYFGAVRWAYCEHGRRAMDDAHGRGESVRHPQHRDRIRSRRTDRQHRDPAAGLLLGADHVRQRGRRVDLRKVVLRHRVLRACGIQLRTIQARCWRTRRLSRRSTVDPSRRPQLCKASRERADTEGWRALVAQHGTPLLVLDPYRVVEQCRLLASHLRGFRLHYAVKTCPHPAVLRAVAASGCGFDVATSGRSRSHWCAWSSIAALHLHPPRQEAHRHRPRIHRRRPHFRRRQSAGSPEVHGPAFRHRHPGAARVPQPVGEIGSVDEVRRRPGRRGTGRQARARHRSPLRRLQLSRRQPGHDGRAVPAKPCAARSTWSRTSATRSARRPGSSTSAAASPSAIASRCPRSTPSPTSSTTYSATAVTSSLCLAEPGRFLAADCMTLLTSVVGSAVRDGRMWHYLDDGIYGSYSNVMTEDVHPPILALHEVDRRNGRLRAGDAGRADMRQRRRHRPRLSDARS